MITLKLLDSIDSISAKINSALSTELNKRLAIKQKGILSKCKSLVVGWLSGSPEIESLSSANPMSLAGLFGLPPIQQSSIEDIIKNAVASSVVVETKKFNNTLTSGGIDIYFQPRDFTNLLGLSSGHVIDGMTDLHWMKWLLELGDSTIITNYRYNPSSGRGRSGLGTMSVGGSFRVPPQFSGTKDNNFITRALIGDRQNKEISKIFINAIG